MGKMKRTKTGKMRDDFRAFGQITILKDGSLGGMTARQEDLLHQMMTEQEESNPEQVKRPRMFSPGSTRTTTLPMWRRRMGRITESCKHPVRSKRRRIRIKQSRKRISS